MITRKVDRCKQCRQPRIMWVPDRVYPIEDTHKSKRYKDLNTGKWIQGTCRCHLKKTEAAWSFTWFGRKD